MTDLEIIEKLKTGKINLKDNYYKIENNRVIELRIICENLNDEIFKKILKLSNLKYLELRSTKNITEIPNEISNLSKLEYLNLDDNKITSISNEISKLNSLKTLVLSRNNLMEFPNALSNIISLEKLNLSGNKLKTIKNNIINLENLEYLNLSNNQKEEFYIDIFSETHSKSLQEVFYLLLNEIRRIPISIFKLTNLKVLDLRGNLIEKIPNKISELTELEELYLSSNEIEELPNGLFELKKLKKLLLSSNKLTQIENDFYKLRELEELDLEDNKIDKFSQSIGNLKLKVDKYPIIQRFFYPIGHGGFYAEKHYTHNNNVTIVYDCGSRSGNETVQPVIEKAFKEDEVIDILFISHFDADHVNKIKLLKERTKIKQVVMPLLQEEEVVFLINIYRLLKFNILTLLKNPEKFFGDDTKIIKVKSNKELERVIENMEVISIDNIPHNSEIESGTLLRASNSLDWVFIPYNYEYLKRNEELENFLKLNTTLDIERLKTDSEYTLETIVEDNKKTLKITDKIKNIYNDVDGNINQNSMVLYSGVVNFNKSDLIKKSYTFDFEDYYPIKSYTPRVSCLYTGDTELDKVGVKIHFSKFWESIGTIQIPHHGSIKNFEKSILDDNIYMCPMSVSSKSLKGHHPNKKVVDDIISQKSFPIIITKKLNSGFIECISRTHSLGVYSKNKYFEYRKKIDDKLYYFDDMYCLNKLHR